MINDAAKESIAYLSMLPAKKIVIKYKLLRGGAFAKLLFANYL